MDVRSDAGPSLADSSGFVCPSAECQAWRDYGDLGLVDGVATRIDSSYLVWRTNVPACSGDPALLMMDLIGGNGAMKGGVKTGTYTLGEDDFEFDTCGACVRLSAQNTDGDARCYFSAGGTLTLTAVDDRLAGSITHAAFRAISCEDFSPLETTCSSVIERIAFDDDYSFTD